MKRRRYQKLEISYWPFQITTEIQICEDNNILIYNVCCIIEFQNNWIDYIGIVRNFILFNEFIGLIIFPPHALLSNLSFNLSSLIPFVIVFKHIHNPAPSLSQTHPLTRTLSPSRKTHKCSCLFKCKNNRVPLYDPRLPRQSQIWNMKAFKKLDPSKCKNEL